MADHIDIVFLLDDLYECVTNGEHLPYFMDRLCEATGSYCYHFDVMEQKNLAPGRADGTAVIYTSPEAQSAMPEGLPSSPGQTPHFDTLASCRHLPSGDFSNCLNPFGEMGGNTPLVPAETREMAGINLTPDESTTVVAQFHQRARCAFRPEARATFSAIAPHFRRFYKIHRTLEESTSHLQSLSGALDYFRQGIALLNTRGIPLFVNRKAKHLLDTQDGVRLECGHLRLRDANAQRRFTGTLAPLMVARRQGLILPPPEVVAAPRQSGELPLQVLAEPLGVKAPLVTTPTIAVFIFDPQEPALLAVDALKEVYGLTTTEARLAILLCQGNALEQAAVQLGQQLCTSRNLLKRVFTKTGTHRQHTLCAVLLKHALPAMNL